MSRAEPMDADYRAIRYILNYAPDGDDYRVSRMTPRQRRRWVHKLHRTGERWPSDSTKGRPTPRQRKRASRG